MTGPRLRVGVLDRHGVPRDRQLRRAPRSGCHRPGEGHRRRGRSGRLRRCSGLAGRERHTPSRYELR